MLNHLRRGHHHEFDEVSKPMNPMNGNGERWKSSERVNPTILSNNLISDTYSPRLNSATSNPDLSRAHRFDAYLLAIVRIEDKRNAFYSAEVVSKLRQKEQTQSFINKPCSLYVTDHSLVIFDRVSQVVAETIPLENVDPTCVHADVPDTLNDIFMYRLLDRQLATGSYASSTHSNDSSSVIVFKCSNNDAKMLVDTIRTATGKPIKKLNSASVNVRNEVERRPDVIFGVGPPDIQQSQINTSYTMSNQQIRSITQQTTMAATDYYKRLTEELNKCFDDIELFVRYLEALMEYTKELERDQRRKEKKSSAGLKQMVEKLPDDRYFIDILQKFKYSFNLLGELKHIIHNPNAPELVHYILSPLQFILYTLRTKHVQQLKLAQEIWVPAITKEAKELLLNCLTSKEHEILRNLGPAWIRTVDESIPKFSDYRPVFFNGHGAWVQSTSSAVTQPSPLQSTHSNDQARAIHPFTKFDERQQIIQTTARSANQNNNNNGVITTYNNATIIGQQPSPVAGQFDTSTVDRSVKNGVLENFNAQMQNEHAWAIERKQTGAKICAVKMDRNGQNHKELTVHRGELIEIEDSSKKWWRAKNFRGEIGHVPNNIVEEIEIEYRPHKVSPAIPPGVNLHPTLSTTNIRLRNN